MTLLWFTLGMIGSVLLLSITAIYYLEPKWLFHIRSQIYWFFRGQTYQKQRYELIKRIEETKGLKESIIENIEEMIKESRKIPDYEMIKTANPDRYFAEYIYNWIFNNEFDE